MPPLCGTRATLHVRSCGGELLRSNEPSRPSSTAAGKTKKSKPSAPKRASRTGGHEPAPRLLAQRVKEVFASSTVVYSDRVDEEGRARHLVCGPKGCRPVFQEDVQEEEEQGVPGEHLHPSTGAVDVAHHHGHTSSAFAMRHLSSPLVAEDASSLELSLVALGVALNLRLVDTFMMRRLRSSLPLTHTLITLPLKYAEKRMQPQQPTLSSSASRAYASVPELSSSKAMPLLFAQQQHAPVYSMSFGGSSRGECVVSWSSSSSSYLPPSMHRRASPDHHQHSYHGHDNSALHPLSSAAHSNVSQHSASISKSNMTVGSPAAAVAATATARHRPTQPKWGIPPEEFEAEGDLLGAYAKMLWECYKDHERADALYQLALQCYDMSGRKSSEAISLMGDYTHFLFVSEDCFDDA